ncbi:phage tail tape measure protein [uncultured Bacteroides sp.]|jgi:TP901 family phage tail tape measure protein|uniref:phage tail tape measure protein n=1 Tax=uncultured Bacteroides sp. TaxID=162156 RepID=UPI0025F1F439|nr:phage tail tape measure protein [uncultured Bacteroides sp.]
MTQIKDYQVNYSINVTATEGVQEVEKFAKAMKQLSDARSNFMPAVNSVNDMMQHIDKVFRPKGRKREYTYKFDIDTSKSEKKLGSIKALLTDIKELTTGINVVINAGQKLDTNTIRSQAKALVGKKELEAQKRSIRKTASQSLKTVNEKQREVTGVIGKINSALTSLEAGREINIRTDAAKNRLTEILGLLRQIKTASNINMPFQMGSGKGTSPATIPASAFQTGSILTDKVWQRQQKQVAKASEARTRREIEARQEAEYRQNIQKKKDAFRRTNEWLERRAKIQEYYERAKVERILRQGREEERRQKQEAAGAARLQREQEREQKRNAAASVRNIQRQAAAGESAYGGKRRAAINRLQYSRRPSIRSLPLVNMFNAYMAYGFIKSELSSAVDYSNIMESARSILKVADSDLSTFETRFQQMSYNVRKIGVDTKFTAVEIASAAKFLAMAGMNIATINASMRPISNLALIGDNDVGLIADLTTNIMSGYNIHSGSMGTVADIITSTISRANVNVVEIAESFKMAAGYLKLSGVDFSEASAAIGILGNAGMKGTMAGTALRAMSTRFAKPTKQAEATLDRLGVKFTRFTEIAGKKVEKLRPLAEIFKDLHDAGASLEDMISIFSKIGGNAAMQFVVNYDKLRVLTTQNRASHGISDELALVKQNTTKGLWAQVTSTLTESFMQAYEVVEPVIKSILKDFLSKFKAPEFARGIASIGRALLDVCSVLANLGTWMARNFHWIEPLLFTGFVATKIFKLAGAVTNLGVAIGCIGKQSVMSSTLQLIASLTGGGGGVKALSFAGKRSIVTALRGAGITGKGAMMQALASTGMAGMGRLTARSAFTSLFANQVVTGTGITGAAASLSAMGAGAVAATAGIAALVGALGWVAYKTWQVKKAKDAVLEEVNSNEKYRYPSIDALHKSLRDTYLQALKTKEAVANVTEGKTLEEESGQKIGAFTGEWWRALLSGMAAAQTHSAPDYTYDDAYQKNAKDAIHIIARKSGQQQIISAYAELGKLSSAPEVSAFIKNIDHNYRYNTKLLDKSLYTVRNGQVVYNPGMDKITARQAAQTPHFAGYQNTEVVRSIRVGAESYLDALRSQPGAMRRLRESGFSFTELGKEGFYMKDGKWQQKEAGKDATEEEVSDLLAAKGRVRGRLIEMMKTLRKKYGGNEQIAENIIRKAGFDTSLYSNEPGYNDNPLDTLRVTTDGADDGMAGGNYSGTGKLSSAAPKQVIVQITNLLSVGTIDLMKSPEGQQGEIKDLKEQLAQALIDVVHDFDASWNA